MLTIEVTAHIFNEIWCYFGINDCQFQGSGKNFPNAIYGNYILKSENSPYKDFFPQEWIILIRWKAVYPFLFLKKKHIATVVVKTYGSSKLLLVSNYITSVWAQTPNFNSVHRAVWCIYTRQSFLFPISSLTGYVSSTATARLNAFTWPSSPNLLWCTLFSSFGIPFGWRSDSIKQNY